MGSRYIHVIKRKLGAVDRRKTRLVVLGCSQRAGLDYGETFAPVAKASTIRILFALAQVYSLQIHQMDVETAFLYAPLKEVIYMKPPSGMSQRITAYNCVSPYMVLSRPQLISINILMSLLGTWDL